MNDQEDCPWFDEELVESVRREKRLEALVNDMYHLLLKLCISGHDLCLKYESCENCPVAEILKKVR